MTVKPIPDGIHSITPYLIVNDAAGAIEFYKKAFGAEEVMRLPAGEGKLGHAEIQIGDSRVMLADEHPEAGAVSPTTVGGSPVSICFYVEDVDSMFKRAIEAGGKEMRPVADMFYGDRMGVLTDPFGHQWSVMTHIEDLTPEEIGERMAAMMAEHSEG